MVGSDARAPKYRRQGFSIQTAPRWFRSGGAVWPGCTGTIWVSPGEFLFAAHDQLSYSGQTTARPTDQFLAPQKRHAGAAAHSEASWNLNAAAAVQFFGPRKASASLAACSTPPRKPSASCAAGPLAPKIQAAAPAARFFAPKKAIAAAAEGFFAPQTCHAAPAALFFRVFPNEYDKHPIHTNAHRHVQHLPI